ncbi:hypothetical protein BJ684DRAFT_15188 [Piptocephalis cylindrospora]|uniref:Uncharacterized protein n=1 Tax=Piptocephalis cylindrospora TaxID=1907219 RepID=A0A4P9Y687_9FUNG|nr:hypothetical protein BJ684DRAFT_15188 [Piptocephalis cylindrospora]|eukprot:RKP14495.1 hypothetical protein BJ684DRAFT_15188 [Piptocephalis cylindrospora]
MVNGPSNEVGASSAMVRDLDADIAVHRKALEKRRRETKMKQLKRKLSVLSEIKDEDPCMRVESDMDVSMSEEETSDEETNDMDEVNDKIDPLERKSPIKVPVKTMNRIGKVLKAKEKGAITSSEPSKSKVGRPLSPTSAQERKRSTKRAKTQAQRIGLDP